MSDESYKQWLSGLRVGDTAYIVRSGLAGGGPRGVTCRVRKSTASYVEVSDDQGLNGGRYSRRTGLELGVPGPLAYRESILSYDEAGRRVREWWRRLKPQDAEVARRRQIDRILTGRPLKVLEGLVALLGGDDTPGATPECPPLSLPAARTPTTPNTGGVGIGSFDAANAACDFVLAAARESSNRVLEAAMSIQRGVNAELENLARAVGVAPGSGHTLEIGPTPSGVDGVIWGTLYRLRGPDGMTVGMVASVFTGEVFEVRSSGVIADETLHRTEARPELARGENGAERCGPAQQGPGPEGA